MNEVTELRTAVEILRCDHRFPVHAHGSLEQPGACSRCGVPQDTELTPEDLADLLDAIADAWPKHEPHTSTAPAARVRRCALAVARALNSTTEGATTS